MDYKQRRNDVPEIFNKNPDEDTKVVIVK